MILFTGQQQQEVLSISRKLMAAQQESEVSDILAEGLTKLLRYDTLAIYVVNQTRDQLIPTILKGENLISPQLTDWTIEFGKGLVGITIQEGVACCINNAHQDPRSVYPDDTQPPVEHLMMFPLKCGETTWGALVVSRNNEHEFSRETFELTEFLAGYASLSLSNSKLIAEIQEKERSQQTMLSAMPDHIFRLRERMSKLEVVATNNVVNPLELAVLPSLVSTFQSAFYRAVAMKKTIEFDYQTSIDGELGFFEARMVFINQRECLVIVRNLTSAQEAKRQLKNSEALKRVILDTISDAVITVNKNGTILFTNEVVEKIFGYSAEELKNKPLDMLIPQYLRSIHHHALNRYVETGVKHLHSWTGLELKGLHKNQSEVPIEVSFGETKIDDESIFSAIIRDISDRKKEEVHIKSLNSRMVNLLSTMQAAVIVEDEHRKIVLCNEQFCNLFGISATPQQMIGADCSDAAERSKNFFTDPDGFMNRIKTLLEEKVIASNDELHLIDGRVLERDYVPVYVEEKYRGHMWVYRDITLRKQSEAELIKAKKEAEHAMKVKQDFLARMSHELRTPINGVLGLANLMITEDLNRENQDYLRGIRSSGQQLLAVVNDILDLAKIEAGKLELCEKPFEIRKTITSIADSFIPASIEKSITIHASVQSNVPEVLVGDELRIKQILMNLFSNAVKFTTSGSVILECSYHSEKTVFRIKDSGIGIPSHKISSLFENFTQASKEIGVKYGGTGLGLSIVKQLTELQGGIIQVESTEGVGSVFIVTLPLKIGDQASVAAVADDVKFNPFGNLNPFKNARVLVVEDNAINQIVAKNTLLKWGIEVTLAGNGYEALAAFKKNDFDLILMDIQMPDLDGFETTHIIRTEFSNEKRNIPIIAMTASVLYNPDARARESGMNDYISKPFAVGDLHRLLSKYLSLQAESTASSPAKAYRYLNFDYLNSISPNNQDFVLQMAKLFAEQAPMFLEQVKTNFIDEDYKALARCAHSFKPQGAYLGIDSLKNIVSNLEECAYRGTDMDSMAGLIAQAEILIEAVMEEIHELVINNQ